MAISTVKKISVAARLDNGTDSQGNVKTVNVSIGNMSETNFDDDKALAVVSALGPCLSKTVVSVEKTEIDTLTAA